MRDTGRHKTVRTVERLLAETRAANRHSKHITAPRGHFPLLRHETCRHEPVEVMRQRRSGNAEPLLQPANRQPGVAGPYAGTVKLHAWRFAEGSELFRYYFMFVERNDRP